LNVDSIVLLQRDTIETEAARLAALRYEPPATAGEQAAPGSGAAVILAHGYTGSKETMDVLAGYLCSRGWRCMTFDFRGHKLGGSTGVMRRAEDAVSDLRAAVRTARVLWSPSRTILIGHSFGGAVALALAEDDGDIGGVAVLGTGAAVIGGFATRAGEALMAHRGDYVRGRPAAAILAESGVLRPGAPAAEAPPALFVAARGDIIVPADRVRELAGRYGPTAKLVLVEGGHMDLPTRGRGHVANWLDGISGGSPGPRSGARLPVR